MRYQYNYNGVNVYLKVTADAGDSVKEMTQGMLQSGSIKGLVCPAVSADSGALTLLYNLTGYTTFAEILKRPLCVEEIKTILLSLIALFLDLEDYMISGDSVLWDLNYVYVSWETREIGAVCVPVNKAVNKAVPGLAYLNYVLSMMKGKTRQDQEFLSAVQTRVYQALLQGQNLRTVNIMGASNENIKEVAGTSATTLTGPRRLRYETEVLREQETKDSKKNTGTIVLRDVDEVSQFENFAKSQGNGINTKQVKAEKINEKKAEKISEKRATKNAQKRTEKKVQEKVKREEKEKKEGLFHKLFAKKAVEESQMTDIEIPGL